MAHSVVRYCLLAALALALPVKLAAAQAVEGRASAAWEEALLAEVQAAVAATPATPAVAPALPCSPDCDALNGTACSPVGAKTTCYVPVPSGCHAYTCRCSGSGWACP